MQKKILVTAIGASMAILAPTLTQADVELLGKAVQLYGKVHVSVDAYDRGSATPTVVDPKGLEITSNSSRIGFKGEKEIKNGVNAVWKFESQVDFSGETGTLEARNRYLGLAGNWGTLVGGIHDTPLKDLGAEYSLFGDTIGDSRSVLGQTSAAANVFNQRANNMLLYKIKAAGFEGKVLYATDFQGANNPDANNTLTGASISYAIGGFSTGIAYEDQRDIGATTTTPAPGSDANAIRIGAKYKFGAGQVGGIYEKLNNDGFGAQLERNAYGVHANVEISNITLAAQYLMAKSSQAAIAVDDGVSQYSAGVYGDLSSDAQVYLMYASLKNDAGASYRLARSGHGQAYAPTLAGEKVNAVSLGLVYKF